MNLSEYEWPRPHGLEPFDHQKVTSEFLISNRKAFCFNEQGTGKTASVIWAVDYLMSVRAVRRVLVVCPLSIMRAAWQNDLFKFAIHRTVAVAYGSAAKRKEIINSGAEFVVINFDGVAIVKKELLAGGFDLIVVDEASAYKNAQTDRWKALRDLNKVIKGLWMLTGTPAAQSPADAYGLAKLINPTAVSPFFGQFKDTVMTKVSMYRWLPKPNAQATVHKILQPAIRFEKAQCLDLPPVTFIDRDAPLSAQQQKFYNILRKQMLIEAAGEEITAVNAAVQVSKLLQISCIAYNTPVLTQLGWMPICNVTPDDYVWDGEEWVHCDGAILKGVRQTVVLDGVTMTPEHLVLTSTGWKPAKECVDGYASERFNRAAVRLPDRLGQGWYVHWENEESDMALPLRLRGRSGTGIPELALCTSTQRETLWVPPRRAHNNAWDDGDTPVQHLGGYATKVLEPQRQRLQELRRTGHNGVQALGKLVREFLGGYAGGLRRAPDTGPQKCKQGVQQGKLPLGYATRAGQQHEVQSCVEHPQRYVDSIASSKSVWDKASNAVRPTSTLQMAADASTNHTGEVAVYDLVNCGPRNRFVVRGVNGEHLIVHNCGSVYTDTHEVIEFDVSNRLNVVQEIIDETSNKVLVFVPFTHTIDLLKKHLENQHITCEVINGSVSLNQRSDIVKSFQERLNPKVLIIQPQAASHGLTLTAADTIIWYAPCTSVETYLQANARIDRPGQKNNMTIVHISGSPVETKVYSLLRSNIGNHQKIIDLYRQEISSEIV